MPDQLARSKSMRWAPREKILAGIATVLVCAWLIVMLAGGSDPDSLTGATGFLEAGHLASLLESVEQPLDTTVGNREVVETPYAQLVFQEFQLGAVERDDVYELLELFHRTVANNLEERGCHLDGQSTGGHYLGNPAFSVSYSRGPITGIFAVHTFRTDDGVMLVYRAYERPR